MRTATRLAYRQRVLFAFAVIFTLLYERCQASQGQLQSLSLSPTWSPYSDDSAVEVRSNVKAEANVQDDDDDVHDEREHDGMRPTLVSEHEKPRQAPVKIRINGDLATPPPYAGINLGFVPKQTYYQVRRYDTRLHLPRSAAIDEAETLEELLNAPRLRQVVSHKKTQQVYEEQGYEDAAYDHGGYKKAGQRYENHYPSQTESSPPLLPPSTAADAEYASDSNRRAQIDDRSSLEQGQAIDSSTSGNGTDGKGNDNDNDNDENVKSGPRRKMKDKTAEYDTSGEGDNVDDDHRHHHRHAAAANAALTRYKPKPKARATVQSHHKTKNDDAESKKSRTKSPPLAVSYIKRRRKTNDDDDDDDDDDKPTAAKSDNTKLAQQFKSVRSKMKAATTTTTTRRIRPDSPYIRNTDKDEELLQADFVTATTYRPATLPEKLTSKLKSSAKRKPSPQQVPTPNRIHRQRQEFTKPVGGSFTSNTLVDGNGYVFENPFANLGNSHDMRTTYSPLKWESAAATVAYAVNERPLEYVQTPQSPRWYDIVGKSKFLRNKSEKFPYKIVNSNRDPMSAATPTLVINSAASTAMAVDHLRHRGEMAGTSAEVRSNIKTAEFPYEIVSATALSGRHSDARWQEKWGRWPRKRPKYARSENVSSPFGNTNADDSPWIPITPQEAYDIHGYTVTGESQTAASRIPVTESETASARNSLVKTPKMNPIRVLENDGDDSSPPEGSRPLARTVSTSYSIRHEYDRTAAAWPDKPIHRFEGWRTTTLPPQINQSFDSQRKFFDDTMSASTTTAATAVSTATPATKTASSREWKDDSKDIETLSSNRYAVFQPFQHSTTPTLTWLRQNDDKPLQYRHPYLPRDSWNLQTTVQPQNLVSSNPLSDNVAKFNTTAVGNDDVPRLDKIIVYPASTTSVAAADYASSANFVQNLTLAHYADPSNAMRASLPPNYRDRLNTLAVHLVKNRTTDGGNGVGSSGGSRKTRSAAANEQLLNVYMDGSTTEITVDLRKYPFYKSVSVGGRGAETSVGTGARVRNTAGNPLAKYSVLRYISNPNLVPTKTAGQMSFYQSRDRIRCPEPDAPENVIPERERDGDWVGDDSVRGRGEPRVRNVGRSILCHKIKFFGSDPLDNPFFKEESVGFPLIFPTPAPPSKSPAKGKSMSKRAAIMAVAARQDVQDNAAAKKTVRKVHLVGGFINVRDYDVAARAENVSSAAVVATTTTKTITLTNDPIASVVRSDTQAVTNATRVAVNTHRNRDDEREKFNGDYHLANENDKNERNADANADTNAFDRVALKPRYKEPSWRYKKRQQATKVADSDNRVTSNSRIDSLLYVIHPHSGRGKWMKILKVEQVPSDSSSDGTKLRSKQTPQHETVVADKATAPASADYRFVSNDHFAQNRDSCDLGFGFGFGHSFETTHNTRQRDETKRNNVPPVPVPQTQAPADHTYHIGGLLRQVAPLKASQVEINNLQTTAAEENLEQDVDGDGDGDETNIPPASPSSQSIQPRYKYRDHVQFPQPHERLYYYVVDD